MTKTVCEVEKDAPIHIQDPDKVLKWSYKLAREWVVENLIPKGITSSRKFTAYKKEKGYLPKFFPKSPDDYFSNRNSWKGWPDFLGNPENNRQNKYVDMERAAIICRQYEIHNSSEYREWKDRPYNLPARPDQYYKSDWKGWKEFLGGRYQVPPKRSFSKLNAEDVKIIKHQLAMGISGSYLANYFKVSEMQISRIKHGENWSDI